MERIQTEEQYRELIGGQDYTVIKFDTNWCPDCRTLDRFIGDIIEQNPEKRFFAMDAEKFQDVAEQNEVRGIPSLLVYRGGEKIAHLHSKFAKTPTEVSQYLAEIK
ncbi:thioredoxin family protein [Paenibacillus campi]|uniref:thioredoxin family protein n=1 Tax=Paenibacillus campi TaxID=3106031 RepID=UPI002AFFDFA2|nr:thioredoxin family protein [Paenibacillus sp. SGZ-1009]